ncbi:MAG: SDR family oxidoreductase [Myxococcales bacterium]|nr:SDR family oxidoreductase [Myxococcales bacterium]MCB9755217.1 SDR family oxidoreductase [Myxococcales bacterium]
MRGIKGKVAIVSGGAQSIGARVVRALHGAGARVTIADIAVEPGAALARELGDRALMQRTDLARDADIDACVAATAARFGGVDFVLNVACTYLDDGINSSRADWLTALDINLVGGVMLVKAARPHMIARGGGAVVNFGSISAKVAQTGRWLYPVSKAAILQLTRNQAMDLAPDNIRVNSVSPGWTWCRLMDELTEGDRAKTDRVAAPFHLLRRVGDPDEVAQAAVFLCSDDASFITGADLPVDGGYAAMGPERAEPAISKLTE